MYVSGMATTARLAMDTVLQRSTAGVPSWLIHLMEHAHIERLAGVPPGRYREAPEETYLAMQRAVGTCLLDQYIPDNPLTMGPRGFEGGGRGATTGAAQIAVDGIRIDSPEAVVEHLERCVFPRLRAQLDAPFDEAGRAQAIVAGEQALQDKLAPDILKTGYGFAGFPTFAYGTYGYEAYFSAYALYPEVLERWFSLQADLAVRNNRAAARAYREAHLPPLYRLDHDMADSRGTLVRVETLDRIWFPHFTRSIEPLVRAGVRLVWHCDGNLTEMVPRLLECGVRGFQGFQYEDGMDYERICRLRSRDGDPLVIIAGVSVTRALPFGTPQDVRRQLSWLVEQGPRTGLFLGGSSSVAPGVSWENIQTLVDGFRYYRTHGRR
ncbi:MAG: hypothetical protein AB1505_00415 [Candidatus Latescibacterota bacterium]